VGPNTLWPEDRATPREVAWQNRDTLVVVELGNSGIHWLEPRDLRVEDIGVDLVDRSPHKGQLHFISFGDPYSGTITKHGIEFHWESDEVLQRGWVELRH
jgi:hypothetical protein